MYKEIYNIYKKSLDTSTINYSLLSSAPNTIKNLVLALAPKNYNITIENMNNIRIFFRGMPNLKFVFVFVDLNDVEEYTGCINATTSINNKDYFISYRKFKDFNQEELIKYLYEDLYYMLSKITERTYIDFTLILNEDYSYTIIDSCENDKDNLITVSPFIFAPYILLYYILEVGNVIPYSDFMDIFINNSCSDNKYIHKLIYCIADFCKNYSIEQLLDEGLIELVVRSVLYDEV